MKAALQSRWFMPGQPAFRMTPRFVRAVTILCPLMSAAVAFGIIRAENSRHARLSRELRDTVRETARLESLHPRRSATPHTTPDHDDHGAAR